MSAAKPLLILVILLACPLSAGAIPPSADPSTHVTRRPEPCTLYPEPSHSAPSILPDFDLLTERTVVEANVSDPSVASVSLVVVVRNNGSLPLSVTLSATINLGGAVTLEPSRTPLLFYGGTSNCALSVTLPQQTPSENVGYLQINGASNEYPTATESLQVRVAILQWHRVRIDRFVLDPASPLGGQLVQVGAHIVNAGNGPSNFSATVLLDGKPIELRINGQPAGGNTTVLLGPGRFFMLGASWRAKLGGHNILLDAADIGAGGPSEPLGKDSRSASVSVGYNFIDLVPYTYATIFIIAVAAVLGYRYRRQLGPRLRRLKRMLRRGEPGGEGDEGYGDDEQYADGDYDEEEYDDGGYDDDGGGEEAPRPRKVAAPMPGRPAAPAKQPAGVLPAGKKPSPGGRTAGPGAPAGRAPVKAGNAPARGARAPANPPAGPGVIVVGGPEQRPGPGRPKRPAAAAEEEQ